MLLSQDPDVAAIHEAKNGVEAVAAIRDLRPDLVFLDVQMPEMDGIAVVKEVGGDQMPAVVFVTAYDKYAIEAFEINAIDYLLKPVSRERFATALGRAKERLKAAEERLKAAEALETSGRMVALLESLASPPQYVKRLAARSGGRTVFVEVADVEWIQAAENYVEVHAGRSVHLVHGTMNTLEKALDPAMFLRIHRSLVVNVTRIRELQPVAHGEYAITLASGVRLQSSRVYHEKVKALAANPF